MPNSPLLSLLFFMCIFSACSKQQSPESKKALFEKITLKNTHTYVEITPDIGGRLLCYGLTGKESIIKIGQPLLEQVKPVISPYAENIGYLGHIVWLAPQKDWWTHQTLNQERKQREALWPPDPYLIFSKNKVVINRPNQLSLTGEPSPITGFKVDKSFNLSQTTSHLDVLATAENTSNNIQTWSLWFNTRVHADTQVYVPVNSADDVRIHSFISDTDGPVASTLENNILSIDLLPPPDKKLGRQGKLFIQPSAGWMAGIRNNQLFLIEFSLADKKVIHPEHGQVEIYVNLQANNTLDSLIEMELQTPIKPVAPGEVISAAQLWSLHPYQGAQTRAAHIAYIQNVLQERASLH